ncbi:GNAT family N-acetyltransferase, partial [Alcaligenes pakistanensis]
KDAGFLDDLFVLPEQRGGGLGRRLIDAVAQAGKEQGWPFLRW